MTAYAQFIVALLHLLLAGVHSFNYPGWLSGYSGGYPTALAGRLPMANGFGGNPFYSPDDVSPVVGVSHLPITDGVGYGGSIYPNGILTSIPHVATLYPMYAGLLDSRGSIHIREITHFLTDHIVTTHAPITPDVLLTVTDVIPVVQVLHFLSTAHPTYGAPGIPYMPISGIMSGISRLIVQGTTGIPIISIAHELTNYLHALGFGFGGGHPQFGFDGGIGGPLFSNGGSIPAIDFLRFMDQISYSLDDNTFGGHAGYGGSVGYAGGSFGYSHAIPYSTGLLGSSYGYGGAGLLGGSLGYGGAGLLGGSLGYSGAGLLGGSYGYGGAGLLGGLYGYGGAGLLGGSVGYGGAGLLGGSVGYGGAGLLGGSVGYGGAGLLGGSLGFSHAIPYSAGFGSLYSGGFGSLGYSHSFPYASGIGPGLMGGHNFGY